MIIFGDFDYPDSNWELKSLEGISAYSVLFLDTINGLFKNQLASEPTRFDMAIK